MPKILVVDDQRNMRTTLAMMLRGAGYEVDEAERRRQGADMGAKGAYDIVLTDLRMGRIDGLRCCEPSRRRSAMTEVIVMTAYGTIESAVEAMRLGAFDYIQKPFTEQELCVKVEKALENRQAARARSQPSPASSGSATSSRTSSAARRPCATSSAVSSESRPPTPPF